LARIPDEIGPNLLSLFQPTPRLRPLFNIFVAALKARTAGGRLFAIITAAIRGYWLSAVLGLLPGMIVIAVAYKFAGGIGFTLLGALLALLGLVAGLLLRLLRAAKTDLVESDFGLCPGINQPGAARDAFTNWLAGVIADAAGRGAQDPPLTFGELAAPPDGAPPIRLAMITTSLMEERPYTLPLPKEESRFVFEKSEWVKIFPQNIMSFLVARCEPFAPPAGEAGEYYYFPDPDRLPIVVGARMSLSFPGLISAVPLWRRDFTLAESAERDKLRRCLFSDGGLSSNFPIHFFDRLLPNSPTFAISLDDYDEKRNKGPGRDEDVWLPKSARSGIQLGVQPFNGLGQFLMRLVYSAKDWQDNLQSTLPGYRERIAHVILKPEEGGLNLAMDEATIRKLVERGRQAGLALRDQFDLDAHRWRRFLVAMARMEETLNEVTIAYEQVPGRFGDFLLHYASHPASYKQNPAISAEMLRCGAALAALGDSWRQKPTIRDGHIPKPDTNLRITPRY
jgi:hypothetical protein